MTCKKTQIVNLLGDGSPVSSRPIPVLVVQALSLPSTASLSINEGQTVLPAIGAIGGLDPTYAITGGSDQALFTIDSVTGVPSFLVAPDFENPTDLDTDNAYVFEVTVSDTVVASVTQVVTVDVQAVSESAPVITSSATPSITAGDTEILTVTATDADLPSETLTFSVSGTDAGLVSINSSTGVLAFDSASTEGVYSIQVEVSDGTNTTTQNMSITVNAVVATTYTIHALTANPTVQEGAATGTVVTGLEVRDDQGNPQTGWTFTIDTNPYGAYQIDGSDFEVADGSKIVFNQPPPVGGDADLTTLTVQAESAVTGPITFGHAFKQGDVPSGKVPVVNVTDSQCDILSTWPDGSARTALVTASKSWSLGANPLTVGRGDSTTGTNLTEAAITSSGHTCVVTFSNGVTGSVSLASLIGLVSNGAKDSPGLVSQRIAGPEMSEFKYYSPVGSDAHMAVWFTVRIYKTGQAWIRVAIENGWFNVAAPQTKNYDVSVAVDGATVLTKTGIAHLHHQRPTATFWAGTTVDAWPAHDLQYFKDTKLSPNYASRFSEDFLNALGDERGDANNWFSINSFPSAMGSGGYDKTIGVMPVWDIAKITENDKRAWDSMLTHADNHGVYGIHLRDENTLEVPVVTDYTQWAYNSGGAVKTNGNALNNTPAPLEAYPSTPFYIKWESSHHPAPPFLAAILTGDEHYIEEVAMCAATCVLTAAQVGVREGGSKVVSLGEQERRAAWKIRTLAMASAIVTGAVGQALKTATQQSVDFYYNLNIAGTLFGGRWVNNIGIYTVQTNYINTGAFPTMEGLWVPWQHQYIVLALSLAADINPDINNVETVRNHGYKFAIGLTGDSSKYNPQRAGQYAWPVATNKYDGVDRELFAPAWFTDFSQAKAAIKTAWPTIDETVTPGGVLYDTYETNAEISLDHWHVQSGAIEMHMVLAYAFDNNVPGAEDALRNWSELSTNVSRIPDQWEFSTWRWPAWAAKSRTPLPSLTLPTWLSPTVDTWSTIPNSDLDSAKIAVVNHPVDQNGNDLFANKPLAFGGLAVRGAELWSLAGGGHADGWINSVYKLDASADAVAGWQRLTESSDPVEVDASHNPDGQPASRHTYYSGHWCPSIGRFVHVYAAATAGIGFANFETVDAFDPVTNQWDPAGTYPNGIMGVIGFGAPTAQLPDDSIYLVNNQNRQLTKFRPAQADWQMVNATAFSGSEAHSDCGMCYDSQRDRLILLRRSGSLWLIDPISGVPVEQLLTGVALPSRYTTLVYVAALDLIFCVGGNNTDNTLYTINPATFVAQAHGELGTGPTVALPYNRFGYMEPIQSLFYAGSNADDVKYLRVHNA